MKTVDPGVAVALRDGAHPSDPWSVEQILSFIGWKPLVAKIQHAIMKSPTELNQTLRQQILGLPRVTERPHAGIHEDAFLVDRTMFMHIHGQGHCDIRLSLPDQARVLAEGKARPHRWAPEKGYVTFVVNEPKDLEPAMELIRLSHQHFAHTPAED